MGKTTINSSWNLLIPYSYYPEFISPFDISSDHPDGDFTNYSLTKRKGVLNVVVYVPTHTNIVYPPECSSDNDVTLVCDLAKCAQK